MQHRPEKPTPGTDVDHAMETNGVGHAATNVPDRRDADGTAEPVEEDANFATNGE